MKFYAKKDINDFVVELYNPHDEFDLAADIVEITAAAYSNAISSGETLTDYKLSGQDLVLDTASQADTIAKEDLVKAKGARNEALNNLVHDFGDGRVMQVREKDESNIRNAIEIMIANNMTSMDWVMLDDIKYPTTIEELQAGLLSGQMQGLTIWGDYNP